MKKDTNHKVIFYISGKVKSKYKYVDVLKTKYTYKILSFDKFIKSVS